MGKGCRGQPILNTDVDREHFAHLLCSVAELFDWKIYNWVLMPNHHHLVLELESENLDEGMKRLHGLFAQRWNTRHESTGHVFFRRFKNIPLKRPGYPATVMKYVDLNPVRAGLCLRPEDWEWSGYAAIIGKRSPLPFHDAENAVRIVSALDDEPAANRLAYARAVATRIEADRNRGTTSSTRPLIDEILVDGDAASLLEAYELWGYTSREIAAAAQASHVSVMKWIREERFPPQADRHRGR